MERDCCCRQVFRLPGIYFQPFSPQATEGRTSEWVQSRKGRRSAQVFTGESAHQLHQPYGKRIELFSMPDTEFEGGDALGGDFHNREFLANGVRMRRFYFESETEIQLHILGDMA